MAKVDSTPMFMDSKDLETIRKMYPVSDAVARLSLTGASVSDECHGVCAIVIPRPSTDEAKLNKTEKSYLAFLRRLGYPWIGIQNITFKLADDTRYTPDFNRVDADGNLVFSEVKGFMRDDAYVKIKVAARSFTWAHFELVFQDKRGVDGFRIVQVKP